MTARNPDAQAAVQYLLWALEEIEKSGHVRAARHARMALEDMRALEARSNDKSGKRAERV